MGLLDAIANRLGYSRRDTDPYALIPRQTKTATMANPPAWLQAEGSDERYSIPGRELPEAQLELYQRLSWLQIAVNHVATTAAGTGFNVMQADGEQLTGIPNHPFEILLRRPNPLASRAEFLTATFSQYDLTGNAYWWLNKASESAPPDELWNMPPHKMQPVPDGRMFLRGYLYESAEGVAIPLEPWEVVHFRRWHPLNAYVGLSPVEALATIAAGDMAMQKWNTNYFGKDNAKLPGALAFADPIDDDTWKAMKGEVRKEYGGTERRLMMLRNVGKGGVEWIQMSMSQADMQFLEGRTANREEIFAMVAPGLASMLDVNATEANAKAGERTFMDKAVWPIQVFIAEKITNDVLPAYGPNLVGQFDDVRITDKQMELAEIQSYAQTHTVDEVRAKWYRSDPIGDVRGSLLPSQAASYTPPAEPAQDNAPATAQPDRQILGYHIETGTVTRNEARAPLGLPPVDDTQDKLLRDLNAKLDVIAKANNTGIPALPLVVAKLMGFDVEPQEPPTPPQLPPPADTPMMEDNSGDMPPSDMEDIPDGEMQAQGQRQQEVKAFKRWMRKRPTADPLSFKRVHLSEDDVLELAGYDHDHEYVPAEPIVKAAIKALDVWVMDLTLTRDVWLAAKAMVLQTLPGDDDAEEAMRVALETRSKEAILKAFREQWRNLLPENAESMDLNELMAYINARLLPPTMRDAVTRTVIDGVDMGINIAMDNLERIGAGFDYTLANTRARDWAQTYSADLIRGIEDTTKESVRQSVARWYENGEPISALRKELEPTFGEKRAEVIAQTETTRAAAYGSRTGFADSGVVTGMKWKTVNDERQCHICGELDGTVISLDGRFWDALSEDMRKRYKRSFELPPAHPRCRCRITAQLLGN